MNFSEMHVFFDRSLGEDVASSEIAFMPVAFGSSAYKYTDACESELDFAFIFQGGKPSTQDAVVMLDDLLCREMRRIPNTFCILNKDDVIAKARRTAAGGIYAILCLQARDDQFPDSPRVQFTVQVRFVKGVRSLLLMHACRITSTAIILDIDDWYLCRARLSDQPLDFCEEFIPLVYRFRFWEIP